MGTVSAPLVIAAPPHGLVVTTASGDVLVTGEPRGDIVFSHPILGTVGSIPTSNRATYAQIIVLSRPKLHGESILTLGQSGFIQFVPPSGFTLDPHFGDQLELYRGFHYKPMRLFHDTRRHD